MFLLFFISFSLMASEMLFPGIQETKSAKKAMEAISRQHFGGLNKKRIVSLRDFARKTGDKQAEYDYYLVYALPISQFYNPNMAKRIAREFPDNEKLQKRAKELGCKKSFFPHGRRR